MKTIYFFTILLLAILPISLINGQIINTEVKRIATDTTGFAGNIGLSLSASKFTQSYLAADLNGQVQFKTKRNLYMLFGEYDVVNAGGTSFNNSGFFHFRFNTKITKVIRFEAFSQAQYNSVTKLTSRLLNGLGLRFKLSQMENAKFYWGVAGMYEHEVVEDEGTRDDIRLSSYLTWTLTPESTVSFSNTTYAQPRADNFSDFRLSNNSKLLFNITEKLRFTTVFSFLYDAEPPIDIPKVNYQVRNGLAYKLH